MKSRPASDFGGLTEAIESRDHPDFFSEKKVWGGIEGCWGCLSGCFDQNAYSLEWHDFKESDEVDWGGSFQPGSLEICINLSGYGRVEHGGKSIDLQPMTMGFYLVGADDGLKAERLPGRGDHRFFTVEMGLDYLRPIVGKGNGIHPVVARSLKENSIVSGLGAVQSIRPEQQTWIRQFHKPPTPAGAKELWFRARIQELIAECLYSVEKALPRASNSVHRSRIDQAMTILRNEMEDPPTLENLGKRVGSSPFHLSRIFKRGTGMTIARFIRRARIEAAAELLRAGDCNVTGAALEVGYSSVSHFSVAFCQEKGVCPALYARSAGEQPNERNEQFVASAVRGQRS